MDLLAPLILVTFGSATAGYLTGRLLAVVVVSIAVPVVYLRLDQGWWGSGLGDGWQLPAIALTAAAVIAALGGVYTRRRSSSDKGTGRQTEDVKRL